MGLSINAYFMNLCVVENENLKKWLWIQILSFHLEWLVVLTAVAVKKEEIPAILLVCQGTVFQINTFELILQL